MGDCGDPVVRLDVPQRRIRAGRHRPGGLRPPLSLPPYFRGQHAREPGAPGRLLISGAQVARLLDELACRHGLPAEIVMDNGPEFTGRALFAWSARTGVRLRFIQPGKPIRNAFVGSFIGRFRDECLD